MPLDEPRDIRLADLVLTLKVDTTSVYTQLVIEVPASSGPYRWGDWFVEWSVEGSVRARCQHSSEDAAGLSTGQGIWERPRSNPKKRGMVLSFRV